MEGTPLAILLSKEMRMQHVLFTVTLSSMHASSSIDVSGIFPN